MGQTLSEPITHKNTSSCENEFLKVGASCMQGWRISKYLPFYHYVSTFFITKFFILDMEDAHTQILSLNDDKNAAFFAVYDGHGGSKVAEYAGSHLHDQITKQQTFSNSNN
jgi:protein phosphatase 2C family protein 2/3